MNTAVVNVKVNPQVKKEAQKVAAELGLTLSALVNGYLKQLIRNKTVVFSFQEEESSDYLLESLRASKEDIKAGRVITFRESKGALNYIDEMIVNEQKSGKN